MKKRTFILSSVLSLCLLLSGGNAFAGQQDITVFLNNGEQIIFDVVPVIENGRTLVPMRAIGEALGISLEWNQKGGKVYCVGETLYCTELTIGKNTASQYQLEPDESNLEQLYKDMIVTGEIVQKPMDVPAKIVQGRTLVPLRFLSETYGCEVQYDGTKKRINIVTDTENPTSYQEEPAPAPPVKEPEKPAEVIKVKVGDRVEAVGLFDSFVGKVKAVDGSNVQVYWYDVEDWIDNSIVHKYKAGDSGGLLGGARLYQTTWINIEKLSK